MPVHGRMISKELNSKWTLHKSLVSTSVRKDLGLILTCWQREIEPEGCLTNAATMHLSPIWLG
jgi:hypothetical protein